MNSPRNQMLAALLLGCLVVLSLSGCPPIDLGNLPGDQDVPPAPDSAEYDAGFAAGFLQDDYYWDGFWDSMETVDAGPILYQGGEIPAPQSPEYDAGYWDGVWYAYNDGYFVAYDDAFTIGFSEGYDVFFSEDGLDRLEQDAHIEYYDGGFSDGYNDGFSEGRILGATDYLQGLPFDWVDALIYYREPNDVYIEELDLGTGEFGPVVLYVYGTDPNEFLKSGKAATTLRPRPDSAMIGAARTLSSEAEAALDVTPEVSPRSEQPLTLDTSWLDRIEEYEAAQDSK